MPVARSGAAAGSVRAAYPELAYYSRVRLQPAANDNARPPGRTASAIRTAGALVGAAIAGFAALSVALLRR